MNRDTRPPDTVIASYVFCPESWRLVQVGHSTSTQPARDAGTARHAEKATA
jgi:hypothetical protein